MLRYKNHKNACFGLNNKELSDEQVTFLSFDKWVVFYEADPENWENVVNSNYTYIDTGTYWLPRYYSKQKRKSFYIKFLTRKDYRKYIKFMKHLSASGEDIENTKETMELAQIIGERSRLRLEAAQREAQKAYDEHLDLIQKITKRMDGDKK